MCCFLVEQVYPPTAAAKKYVEELQIIMYIQITLGFLKLFAGGAGIGFMDFLASFVLWQGYYTINHCSMIIYIFINGMVSVMILTMVGTFIQNDQPLVPGGSVFLGIIIYGSLIFYGVSIWRSFLAYREFKAILYDYGGVVDEESNGFLGVPQNGRNDRNTSKK